MTDQPLFLPTKDRKREELDALLNTLAPNVYFQPKTNVKIEYPCIVYERDYRSTQFAGNLPYRSTKRYQVTIIDQDPDSEIPDKVAALPMSAFQRHFAADNLNHDIYSLYY